MIKGEKAVSKVKGDTSRSIYCRMPYLRSEYLDFMQRADQSSTNSQFFASRIQRQEETLLRELYEENFRQVETYILKNSGNSEDARDLYQEAFLAVWRNIQLEKFLPGDRNEFAAYLFQVSRFKWIDLLRTRKVRPIVPLNDRESIDTDVYETDTEEAKLIKQVRNKFSELGIKCRDLLTRFYFQKQHLREIAQYFDWTEPTAKNNKYRCLQQLRALLKETTSK